jgi:DNA-binding NtrC family response regulator
VLLDVMMPGMDGFETCRRLRQLPGLEQLPVIFMTALSDIQDKVRAFAAGADDYVSKPFQHEEVLARVRVHLTRRELESKLAQLNRELEDRVAARTTELNTALAQVEALKSRLQQENRYLKQELCETSNLGEIIGSAPALQAALRKVAAVAATDSTVLIHGETGTGKELIARALHAQSKRRDKPMIKLNCSAISAGLVESELFGHLKGAFTGATDKRMGRFELADGGTLFLDEVSELPLETQAKLLRVLQEQEFEPVGSSRSVKVDVRVIAATNRDLPADVRSGRFRSDLFYRLNVFPIEVPALRERAEDIGLLANHFMQRMIRKLGKPLERIAPATLTQLNRYSWPGNIRDLQNTIERAAVLTTGSELIVDWDLGPPAVSAAASIAGQTATGEAQQPPPRSADAEHQSLEAIEREHIIATLRRTRGVVEGPHGAAQLLEMNPSTVRFRMKKLSIGKADYLTD